MSLEMLESSKPVRRFAHQTLAWLIIAWVASAAATCGSAQSYQPKVDQPHPEFVLPSIENGQAISLSDYRGKKVLLLHFASW